MKKRVTFFILFEKSPSEAGGLFITLEHLHGAREAGMGSEEGRVCERRWEQEKGANGARGGGDDVCGFVVHPKSSKGYTTKYTTWNEQF